MFSRDADVGKRSWAAHLSTWALIGRDELGGAVLADACV